MGYNEEFFKQYSQYLDEPIVRKSHDFALRMFSPFVKKKDIIADIGCGQCCEYYNFGPFGNYKNYIGFDLDPIVDPFINTIKCDYRDPSFVGLLNDNNVNIFVSLFSTEITADYETNCNYYSKIINDTKIKAGLVAGFYYHNKQDENPITETGDIKSWQTLENIKPINELMAGIKETRITMPVPSKMFGDDVIEIWRIFERT